jgi:Rrf2 family iron-sulfur cluster assembly transcriptional regulator
MRISSKSKIAFQILLDIAAHTAHGRAISIPLMCQRHKLSHSYLETIFSQLRVAGMIKSHRGPGGGYSLSKESKDISLYDVVCLMGGNESAREDLGSIFWSDLDKHMSIQMQQMTLSESLQNSFITIEQGTKGFNHAKPIQVTQAVAAPQKKKELKKTKPRLGPNSVFAFGNYLKTS